MAEDAVEVQWEVEREPGEAQVRVEEEDEVPRKVDVSSVSSPVGTGFGRPWGRGGGSEPHRD